jgi:hypothetical protein
MSGVPGAIENGGDPHSHRQDGVLGTFLYWIDGYGDDGRPSHTKIAAFFSWVFGLATCIYFITHFAPYWFILSWGSLAFCAPYGIKGLSTWLTKGRGY